ncbi:major facilitator superfamily domain-containing protein [Cunninghamella echinulata]|nr:major facilitator superfamily domain-containing protein [Cunninghamella echinulata]
MYVYISLLFIAIVPTLTDDIWNTVALVSLGCFGWSWFGYPVIASFVDSGDYKELYGRQKIGCPIGYGLSIFLAGLTTELFGPYAFFGVYTFFTFAFIITVIQLDFIPRRKPTILNRTNDDDDITVDNDSYYGSIEEVEDNDILAASTIITEHDGNHEGIKQQKPLSIWHLLKNPDAIQFFLVMALMGFSIAVIQAFLFLFMRNDLHATPSTIALLGPLGSFPEVIGFFFTKQIHSKLGPKKMLLLAQFITIFRCLMYVISMGLGEFGIFLSTATQLLHGLGFSLTWSAAALQADHIAPKQLKNSAQGLLNMCFNGIGAGLGSLCGGLIYNSLGAKMMWFSVIFIMLFTIFIYTTTFLKKILPTSYYTSLK